VVISHEIDSPMSSVKANFISSVALGNGEGVKTRLENFGWS
jgi:hypothetical protein